MILAVDIGNTNIVLGCIEDGHICATERIRSDTLETEAEYGIKIKDIIEYMGLDLKQLEGAIISSVVPVLTTAVSKAVTKLIGRPPLVVGPGMKTGMNVKIDDPGSLGADMLVDSVAVNAYYGAPAVVLDMGTATTITVLDKDGAFSGGAIIPGVKLSARALSARTSLLPDISITPPKKCIGTNTVDCMRSGSVYGTAAMIDGMADRMEQELGYPCKVVATGGLAPAIVPLCRRKIICDSDLLLKGLWVLYKKNTK